MPAILVRDLPQTTLDALRRRAGRHRRSLQQELRLILEVSAQQEEVAAPADAAARIRARLAEGGRVFEDSTALIREDRER